MRQLFRSKFQTTQEFGVNAEYYKQFGLKAHEGVDLVPTGTVWDVLCLADGVVVKDEDNALSGAYGNNVTVWHPKLNKATQYCHFKENYVVNGQVVAQGDKLGLMGKTGNTTGAHVHLNLFETDANGVRLNRNNGYLGGIDPLPFLQEEPTTATPETQQQLDSCRVDRDSHWNFILSIAKLLNVAGDKDIITAEVKKLLGVEETLRQKNNDFEQSAKQVESMKAEVADLGKSLKEALEVNTEAQTIIAEQTKHLQEQENIIKGLGDRIEELKKVQPIEQYTGLELVKIGLTKFWNSIGR